MDNKRFVNNEIYHVFNKSISNYGIFNSEEKSFRFIHVSDYYNNINPKLSFSKYLEAKKRYEYNNILIPKANSVVKFLCFCIMPDHYHLLFKVSQQVRVSKYLNDVANSYSRYFNLKHNRKGPLWQSSYKSVRITDNEQLLHVSRYIHLNPTTSALVEKPEEWEYSSYIDFIKNENILKNYVKEISIKDSIKYQKFVEDNKDYQRKLKIMKRLLLD